MDHEGPDSHPPTCRFFFGRFLWLPVELSPPARVKVLSLVVPLSCDTAVPSSAVPVPWVTSPSGKGSGNGPRSWGLGGQFLLGRVLPFSGAIFFRQNSSER